MVTVGWVGGGCPVGGNKGGKWDSKMLMADGARRNRFEDTKLTLRIWKNVYYYGTKRHVCLVGRAVIMPSQQTSSYIDGL